MQDLMPYKQKRKYKGIKYSYTHIYYRSTIFLTSFTQVCCHLIRFHFKLANFLYLCLILIDTGGNCHKIAAKHDRLPPSISTASKDKKGKLTKFFVLNFYMHF